MTSIVNYIIIIALALVITAGALLIYVLYSHLSAPSPTPTSVTATTPTSATTPTQTAQSPTTTQMPPRQSSVVSVAVYVLPADVSKCAGLGSYYLYYFNVTLDRAREEDPAGHYAFSAVTPNGTVQMNAASILSIEIDYFKPYDINVTHRLGLLNIYLEITSDKPLNITGVKYLDETYGITTTTYVSCIKKIVVKLDNTTLPSPPAPGQLGLLPAGKTYTIAIPQLEKGQYRVSTPPEVKAPPEITVGEGGAKIEIELLNKAVVFDPLNITLVKIG